MHSGVITLMKFQMDWRKDGLTKGRTTWKYNASGPLNWAEALEGEEWYYVYNFYMFINILSSGLLVTCDWWCREVAWHIMADGMWGKSTIFSVRPGQQGSSQSIVSCVSLKPFGQQCNWNTHIHKCTRHKTVYPPNLVHCDSVNIMLN